MLGYGEFVRVRFMVSGKRPYTDKHCCQRGSWRLHKRLGGNRTRTDEQSEQRNIPHHVTPFSAVTARVTKEEGQ